MMIQLLNISTLLFSFEKMLDKGEGAIERIHEKEIWVTSQDYRKYLEEVICMVSCHTLQIV